MSDLRELQTAMGALVFSFQQLESELVEIFYLVAESKDVDALKAKNSRIDYRIMIDSILSLGEDKIPDAERMKELKSIINRARKFAKRRNVFIHSHYNAKYPRKKELIINRSKSKVCFTKPDSKEADVLNVKTLTDLISSINALIVNVRDYFEDLFHYLNYEPEEEAWRDSVQIEMSASEWEKFFSINIGDLSNVDTDGPFLLGEISSSIPKNTQ